MRDDKIQIVENIRSLIDSHQVVGVISMHKLPARQLQSIKHSLDAKIKMGKRSLISRSIDQSEKKDVKKLKEYVSGPCALIFTDENPFRLFKKIKEKRMPSAAKAGDIATKDIMIQKGPTGLAPGPAISVLQKAGLKTSVQGGKIAVLQDKVVCKKGDVINADIANVLALLKIEPLEIGLNLIAIYEDGEILEKNILDIDTEEYVREMENCVHSAVNLSVNTGYPTKLTINIMLQKAFVETRALCIDANIVEKEFINDILLRAVREAKSLQGIVKGG